MRGLHRFLRSYAAVMLGLVAVLAGMAALGLFLGFAGEGASTSATVLAVVAVTTLTGGLSLLVATFHRRGGLLRARMSPEDRATYRREYRQGRFGDYRGVPRSRQT